MALLDTPHKKKSFTLTLIFHIGIILLLFWAGLQYLDPPPENGIAVNFGTNTSGSGNSQPRKPIVSSPKKDTPPPTQSKPELKEEVVTQDAEEAPVIKKEDKKEVVEKVEKETPKKDPPKPVERKPDKSTTDALSNLINGPKNDGTDTGSEGNEETKGDQGNPDGNPDAKSYYGVGKGLDGDGNYLLSGRNALNKEKYVQDCNEAGIVVVSIEVNQSGQVISAVPGVRGTTNNSRCLLEPAKKAALATRFNADTKAPAKQIGKIIYHFKLSQ